MKRVLIIGAALLFVFSCRFENPVEDLTIGIDLNIFKTYVSFRFVDAETGERIGSADGIKVVLKVSGEDGKAVVTQMGEQPDQFESVLGMISVALNPYDPYKISPDNPLNFTFEASAPGYRTTRSDITISETGTHPCLVSLQKESVQTSGSQVFTVLPGDLENGILNEGFRLVTPGNQLELNFPDSIQLADDQGNPVSGELKVQSVSHAKLSNAIDATDIMKFFSDGNVTTALFKPVSILEINLSADGEPIRKVVGDPVQWKFRWAGAGELPDSVPVWFFNSESQIWEFEAYARREGAKEDSVYACRLIHFSLYAAGGTSETREISTTLSFTFEKPFFSPSFDTEIRITDATTGNLLQSLPLTLFPDISAPVTLNVPVNGDVRVTPVTPGDNAFRATPAYYTITGASAPSNLAFSLYPLNCRVSGRVTGSFLAGDIRYPVPATLILRDAATGNALLSRSVNLTESGLDYTLSGIVPESRPLKLEIRANDLTKDFLTQPEFILISSPCSDQGPWGFTMDANTCLVNTDVTITLEGDLPDEPVPAILTVRREKDNYPLYQQSFTGSRSNMVQTLRLSTPIPRNTPVNVTISAASTDKPLRVNPSVLRWPNPCAENGPVEFRVSPDYVKFMQTLQFTFDPGLTHAEVPVNLIAYRKSNDQELFTVPLTVTRAQTEFTLSRYLKREPLILKVTRANPSIRFNPEPYSVEIPDPFLRLSPFIFRLQPTLLSPVHFLVKVVCPGGEVLPTVQGYYRIPGDEWKEMNITSGHLNLNLELGLTYEVGMILGGTMIDSTFTVTQPENNLIFNLDPADCKRMGWGTL